MIATSALREITAVARLDLAEVLRSRWLVFCAVVYALLAGGFVLVGMNESTLMGFTGMGRVLLSFSHALLLLLPLLALTAIVAAAVLGASLASVHRTRQLYMSLASFHGYLELAAGSFLYVRGWEDARCPRPAPGSSPS